MDKETSKVPTNEEIIESLTCNLEKSCLKNNRNDSDDIKKNPDEDPWENVGKNENDEPGASEAIEKTPKEDFVDEEALKDRDVGLSEEEKEKLKSEAEELKNDGNTRFKSSEFREASLKYTQALQTCPLMYAKNRAILYANRAAAKAKYDERNSAIEDCTKAIELNPTYVKAYVRRAQFYEQEDKFDESLADYKKIVELDSHNSEANHAIRRLPPLIEAKNEKLKQEMFGKLKDLGNMILKPFGLSTNNFKMEQDAATGGYSVKFNQNSS